MTTMKDKKGRTRIVLIVALSIVLVLVATGGTILLLLAPRGGDVYWSGGENEWGGDDHIASIVVGDSNQLVQSATTDSIICVV